MNCSVSKKNVAGTDDKNKKKKKTGPISIKKTNSSKVKTGETGLSLSQLSLKNKNDTTSFTSLPDLSKIPSNLKPPLAATSNDDSSQRKKRAPWSIMEDNLMNILVRDAGSSKINWTIVASHVNEINDGNRTGKQCRERWLNHLRPGIKKGDWTKEEEAMIRYYYQMFGPKWSAMAQLMKDRTDNDIKNKWNSMNRSARRALDNLTKQGSPNDVEMLHNSTNQMFEGSSWEEKDGASNGTTAAEAAMIFRPRTFPSEPCFTKTVTDGASANNSPVIQKNYWETTLEF